MTDNSRQIIERMQASFPHLYNVYDKSTILYALLSVFGERMGTRTDIIDRLYAMIGIDSTYDEDLEHRWGSLLGVYRQNGESFNDYRSRLLIVYSSLAGGTAEAIKFAIASAIGITSDTNAINQYIKVYDAWKYPYEVPDMSLTNQDDVFLNQNFITNTEVISATYGHIICTVDLSVNEGIVESYDKIMSAINTTKASGIYPYLLFIYITHELVALSYREQVFDKISENRDEIGNLSAMGDQEDNTAVFGHALFGKALFGKSYNTDKYYDVFKYKQNETGTFDSINTNVPHTGINVYALNDDFVTNNFMETDQHSDTIIMGVLNDVDNISIIEKSAGVIHDKYFEYQSITDKRSAYKSLLNNPYIKSNNTFITNDGIEFSDVDDKFIDIIRTTIQESRAVCSDITTTWSIFGTNSAVLNDDFVTNILMTADEYVDKVIYL